MLIAEPGRGKLKRFFRSWLVPVHRWIALTFGIILVGTAVTGACIVFRPQLELMLNQSLLTAAACQQRLPIDDLAQAAAKIRPQATLDYVRINQTPLNDGARVPAVAIRFTDQEFVYLDGCTGEVLGQRHRYGGLLGTVEQLHRWRFIENGSLITGTTAILAAIVLGLGGLVMAIVLRTKPSLLVFRAGLSGTARTLDIHKTIGLYVSLFIVGMAITGLPQAYDWYRKGIYTVMGSEMPKAPPKLEVPTGVQRQTYESLWQTGSSLVPGFSEALMHLPSDPRQPVDMYAIPAGAPHANARTLLWFDPYSGRTLKHIPYEQSSLGFKVYFWTLSLHSGKVGGWPVQLLMLIGALMIPVLFVTGLMAYLRRTRRPL